MKLKLQRTIRGNAALALAFFAAACSSAAPDESERTSSAYSTKGSTQGPPIIYIPPPVPIYNAYVGALGCVPVGTTSGAWYGTPTFPDDPAFCTYAWEGAPVPPPGALENGLIAHGVLAEDIRLDPTCNSEYCARPTVAEAPDQGIIIGGSVNCVKCVHASVVPVRGVPVNGVTLNLHVALAASQVTSGPSRLWAIVDGDQVFFDQPGGVAAFTVGLTDVPSRPSHSAEIPGPGF